ncbi:glutathionyl-hydroquinone reductase [Malassezia psittaci]|uniref:Glutathionyl-hydroquinone reductase n=1 Tax=Malassezia psittaci TaxID=1821823 RepID=A0AAF0F9L5_9BASI|nr:glutathionyl-hydroquinone reductase [Malassezia psittaci]
MSLFGAPASTAAGSNLPRSVSFGAQDTKPAFSFGNGAPSQTGSSKPGLFGAPTAPSTTQNTNLFGSTGAMQSAQTANLPGSSATGQQSSSGSSLFGQNTQQGQSGGLFGASSTPQNTNTGLFNSQNNPKQGQSTGGLFGSQPSAQPNSTNSLFGAPGNASNTPKPGGLFGSQNTTASNPTNNPSFLGASQGKTGLFGQSTTQNQPQANAAPSGASSSLFGAKPSGLFGSSTNPMSASTPNPAGSTSLFGASGTSTTYTPSSALLQHPYYQRERFNELPDQQRGLLEEMDRVIQSQMQIKSELRARDQASEPRQLPMELHELKSLQEVIAASLESDTQRLKSIGMSVERDRMDQLQLYNVVEHAKKRLSDGSSFIDWLRSFYQRAAEQDVARIHRYRVTMEQIERHVHSLDQREQFAPRVIAEIIYDQNASFMGFAEQIATLHAEIETLKKDYVKWYQARFQSVRDPFAPSISVANSG